MEVVPHIQTKTKARKRVTVEMSLSEYKQFKTYKESVRIAKILVKGIRQAKLDEEGKIKLKCAYELLDEL